MSEPSADPMGEIREIEGRMNDSAGMRVVLQTRALGRVHYVFRGNSRELLKMLELFGGPMAPLLMGEESRVELDALLSEVDRLLHNYLAAVKSLVDHTRNLVDRMYPDGSSMRTRYETEKDRLFVTPRSAFVQGLRNVTLHHALPNPIASMTMTRDQPLRTQVLLDAAALLALGDWKSLARTFLESAGENVDLHEVISAYSREVQEFYEWFGAQQQAEHASELAELDRMREEVRAAFLRAGLGDYLKNVDERLKAEDARRGSSLQGDDDSTR